MKNKLSFLVLFISVLSLGLLGSCDHIEYTGYIYGTVMSEDGSSVLSDVIVECGGKSYTTSSNGNYTIKDIPVGNQTLKATKTDYVTYTKAVKVESGGTREDINMVSSTPGRR
jgi:uncharacterized membrane protein